jgi:hypothetical protein
MKNGRVLIGLLLVLAVTAIAGAGVWWWMQRGTSVELDEASAAALIAAELALDSAAVAPPGTRVRVQVLNAGGVSGLARRATIALRDHGYDVVEYGTTNDTGAVTRVQVVADRRAWGERIVRALGTGRVEEVNEPLRYVDVVVRLGRDWTPPSQPLRP